MRGGLAARLAAAGLAVAAFAAVGLFSYNLGVAHGVATSAQAVAAGGPPVAMMWPRPWWGPGFGWFPFFPLLFILFWVVIVRGLFWRGRDYHGWRDGGVPPAFEEWHRRAHAVSGPSIPPSEGHA